MHNGSGTGFFYNKGMLGRLHSPETKKRMSSSRTGKRLSASHRKSISLAQRGAPKKYHRPPMSQAQKNKIAKTQRARLRRRRELGLKPKCRPHSKEHRARISESMKGRTLTQTHKTKISIALKAYAKQTYPP